MDKFSLARIDVQPRSGDESFSVAGTSRSAKLLDFWQWSSSDLIGNSQRGLLSEYIVAMAAGADRGTRVQWDAFDILTPDGIKIEVKSSAYIQTWSQKKHSAIRFDIKRTKGWNAKTNEYGTEARRHADVYVFCLLSHKEQATLDPLNLDQWVFYVIPTPDLEAAFGNQRTVALSRLRMICPNPVPFGELREAIRHVSQNCSSKEFEKIVINGHEFLVGPADDENQVVVLCRNEQHLAPAFDRIGGVDYVGGEFPYRTRMSAERVRLGQELEGKWKQGY